MCREDVSLPKLWDATEDLRDLVGAVEWLLATDPASPTYTFERRRVEMYLEEAKKFIAERDREEEDFECRPQSLSL